MNISPEAREASRDYRLSPKDGMLALDEAMQTLIDQTIERCAVACDDLAIEHFNWLGNHCASQLRSLKSNTDGGGDD